MENNLFYLFLFLSILFETKFQYVILFKANKQISYAVVKNLKYWIK